MYYEEDVLFGWGWFPPTARPGWWMWCPSPFCTHKIKILEISPLYTHTTKKFFKKNSEEQRSPELSHCGLASQNAHKNATTNAVIKYSILFK